ncbi:hypothetical protein GTR02_16405 [Kineococcus sp. R8]|uniref:hypothetical protein n=1 Tax=Kineococcus siccus TaxID=2696567 RepID=UPI001411FAC7|nr:hypothetical protein [Kineococcus siccus]NAZ83401.1 hypothetical protein [Kineococcus siccus]
MQTTLTTVRDGDRVTAAGRLVRDEDGWFLAAHFLDAADPPTSRLRVEPAQEPAAALVGAGVRAVGTWDGGAEAVTGADLRPEEVPRLVPGAPAQPGCPQDDVAAAVRRFPDLGTATVAVGLRSVGDDRAVALVDVVHPTEALLRWLADLPEGGAEVRAWVTRG